MIRAATSLIPPHCFSGYCLVFKKKSMHDNKFCVLQLHGSMIYTHLKYIILVMDDTMKFIPILNLIKHLFACVLLEYNCLIDFGNI